MALQTSRRDARTPNMLIHHHIIRNTCNNNLNTFIISYVTQSHRNTKYTWSFSFKQDLKVYKIQRPDSTTNYIERERARETCREQERAKESQTESQTELERESQRESQKEKAREIVKRAHLISKHCHMVWLCYRLYLSLIIVVFTLSLMIFRARIHTALTFSW